VSAEILANGIPPDIGSDIFDWIGRTKDVIIVARLPETATVRFLEFESGALLEKTDKFAEIGTVVDALRKDVNGIRYEAKRVETERVRDGGIEKELEDVLSVICVGKMRRAAVTADGDEIGLSAKVVFGG